MRVPFAYIFKDQLRRMQLLYGPAPACGVSSFLSVLLEAAEGEECRWKARLCLTSFWGKTLSYKKFKIAV